MIRPAPEQALADLRHAHYLLLERYREARRWRWQAVLGAIVGGWLAIMLLRMIG